MEVEGDVWMTRCGDVKEEGDVKSEVWRRKCGVEGVVEGEEVEYEVEVEGEISRRECGHGG